jgi:hypothetical protein
MAIGAAFHAVPNLTTRTIPRPVFLRMRPVASNWVMAVMKSVRPSGATEATLALMAAIAPAGANVCTPRLVPLSIDVRWWPPCTCSSAHRRATAPALDDLSCRLLPCTSLSWCKRYCSGQAWLVMDQRLRLSHRGTSSALTSQLFVAIHCRREVVVLARILSAEIIVVAGVIARYYAIVLEAVVAP